MHRFEQRGETPFRVEIGRGRDADGAGARRAEVGQDVAEQIRRHDHVKAVRLQDEACAEDVDVLLVPRHLGVVRRHECRALVPVRHADGDAVGLGRRRQAFTRACLGEFESEFEDAVDATAREHRFLKHELVVGALEHLAAHGRIFA
nr:hypothetical protein [Tanacetum cinerariifolium]